ncbi:hypothetical protein L1987_72444 [Smallanthus sonchifolius]|uniref:Uncharacterized protein n=1 Tax=Smallanthus sonchifolius TaxID=185202 RepID=A0ACB9AUE2_9ASTR|nr:hypothetical protein L1987_72444 [Smallanthus sonchifolius]
MNPINGFPKFDMLIPLSFAIDRGQMMLEWRREEWSQELPESVLNRRRTGRSRRRRSSSSNGQLPVQDSEIGYSARNRASNVLGVGSHARDEPEVHRIRTRFAFSEEKGVGTGCAGLEPMTYFWVSDLEKKFRRKIFDITVTPLVPFIAVEDDKLDERDEPLARSNDAPVDVRVCDCERGRQAMAASPVAELPFEGWAKVDVAPGREEGHHERCGKQRSMEGSHESDGREGTMSIITTTASIGDPWEVQYARFFNCPSRSTSAASYHPSLVPLSKKPKGSWISSFTSLASLKLLPTTTDHSDTYRSIILTVTLVDNVLEEHYISKLHFTWPQVSCLTGYSPRGSKVVFMSYTDQVGQIQKFAVRFLTTYEAERFINILKEAFGHEGINGSTSGISKFKTSFESEFIRSFEAENRPTQDWDLIITREFSEPMYRPIQVCSPLAASDEAYIQPLYPTENYDGSLNSNHFSQDVQGKLSAFPPSFTSLLMNCYPVAELALPPTDPEEAILKKDIMKYLEDSSFQEILSKVQKVVNEFDDLLV